MLKGLECSKYSATTSAHRYLVHVWCVATDVSDNTTNWWAYCPLFFSRAWKVTLFFHLRFPVNICLLILIDLFYNRDERAFESLVDETILHDYALKAVVNNLEILIFSSRGLPVEYWHYQPHCLYFLTWIVLKNAAHFIYNLQFACRFSHRTATPSFHQVFWAQKIQEQAML